MRDEKGSQQKHHTVKNITNVVVIRNSCFTYIPLIAWWEKTADTHPLKTVISVHFLSLSAMCGKISYFFLILSPFSLKRMPVCTILSKMASAAVVFTPPVYHTSVLLVTD